MQSFTGGCLCGRVRFSASGRPYRVGICHCLDCRKHHGALFHASAIFPQAAVTIDGETRDYKGRHFCPHCGSTVFGRSGDEIEVNLGSLDAPDLLLAEQCLDENNGRFTEEWLRSAGYSQRHARAIKARWWSNGWLVVDETVLGKPAVLAVQVRERVNSSAADLSCTEAHDKARQAHD